MGFGDKSKNRVGFPPWPREVDSALCARLEFVFFCFVFFLIIFLGLYISVLVPMCYK